VATEAYLDTARRRISVRRHARLVDYRLHEGCAARAWLVLTTSSGGTLDLTQVAFATQPLAIPSSGTIAPETLDRVPAGTCQVFEALLPARDTTITVVAAQSEMRFHTWGDGECCLPRGATRATLVDAEEPTSDPGPSGGETPIEARTAPQVAPRPSGGRLGLRVGDVLVFEEVIGPTTGEAADADPGHRHAVRLTAVEAGRDRLLGQDVVEIEWGDDDALPFALCLSSRTADCERTEGVSVARGNVVLVDHGRTGHDGGWTVGWTETPAPCGCDGSTRETLRTAAPFCITLPRAPLSFGASLPIGASARGLLEQDPRAALPRLALTATSDLAGHAPVTDGWTARLDLLASGGDDPDYVVEVDDEGSAHLRFGDDADGRRPSAGTTFAAAYRVGNGSSGNVGADSIVCVVAGGTPIADLRVRNPLPASGGVDPEPVAEAKLFAPGAIHRRLARAVVAEDYATLARTDPALQNAAASLAWTGSWYEADVAIDPVGGDEPPAALLETIATRLEGYRRIGHDLTITPARYVPLVVELTASVEDGYLAAHVFKALRGRLAARRSADGTTGFFHPDNLTFGQGISVSRLVAAAQAVDGVQHVEVTRLERFPQQHVTPDQTAIDAGALSLGPDEIAQVDDDPSFPEHGTLTVVVVGGR
jgi:hypothetical protein